MKQGERGSTAGGSRRRAFLIATEVGLSLILLIGAGLMIKSFANLTKVDPGFNPDRLLIFNIGASAKTDEDRQIQFYQQVVQQLTTLPGVRTRRGGKPAPVLRRQQLAHISIARQHEED